MVDGSCEYIFGSSRYSYYSYELTLYHRSSLGRLRLRECVTQHFRCNPLLGARYQPLFHIRSAVSYAPWTYLNERRPEACRAVALQAGDGAPDPGRKLFFGYQSICWLEHNQLTLLSVQPHDSYHGFLKQVSV
jgi:hypothetical protein